MNKVITMMTFIGSNTIADRYRATDRLNSSPSMTRLNEVATEETSQGFRYLLKTKQPREIELAPLELWAAHDIPR